VLIHCAIIVWLIAIVSTISMDVIVVVLNIIIVLLGDKFILSNLFLSPTFIEQLLCLTGGVFIFKNLFFFWLLSAFFTFIITQERILIFIPT